MYSAYEFLATVHRRYGSPEITNTTMAELINRLPTNVPGRFYVDDTCIDCDQCRASAPTFFARDDDTGYSYVHRQPTTPEEIAEAEEALTGCPTESIGSDGIEEASSGEGEIAEPQRAGQ